MFLSLNLPVRAAGNSTWGPLHCRSNGNGFVMTAPDSQRKSMIPCRPDCFRFPTLRLSLAASAALGLFLSFSGPALPDDAPAATGLRALVERHQREALRSVSEYVGRNPEADDAEQAAVWMFETALSQGLEAEVVGPAEQFLKRRGLDQPSISLAQQALAVGQARTGMRAEALATFD